jgi:prophage antirepressor-like protein
MGGPPIALFAFEHQRVRAVIVLGVLWFVAADVCKVLGIANPSDAVGRLDDDERDDLGITDPIGRQQSTVVVSEEGVFRLIFESRKPEAERFKRPRWRQ